MKTKVLFTIHFLSTVWLFSLSLWLLFLFFLLHFFVVVVVFSVFCIVWLFSYFCFEMRGRIIQVSKQTWNKSITKKKEEKVVKLQAHREEGKVSWDQQVTFCSETWPTFDNEKGREVNTRDTTQINPICSHHLTIALELYPNVTYWKTNIIFIHPIQIQQ